MVQLNFLKCVVELFLPLTSTALTISNFKRFNYKKKKKSNTLNLKIQLFK